MANDIENNDFADHPRSLAEVKAARSWDAKDWRPRDVLVELLRRIDGGEAKPDMLFVAWKEPESNVAHFSISSPDPNLTHGVVMRALYSSTSADKV